MTRRKPFQAPPAVVTPSFAAEPGPACERWEAARQQPNAFIITGANVTSYWTCEAIAMDMPGDIFAFKEHGIPSRSAKAAQAVAFQQGFGLVAGPLDETGHSVVAVLWRRPARGQEEPCLTEEGKRARQLRRLLIVKVDLPSGLQVTVLSAYCWSGANDRGLLRDRSKRPSHGRQDGGRCQAQ